MMVIKNDDIKNFLNAKWEQRFGSYQPIADNYSFDRVNFKKESFSDFGLDSRFSKFIFRCCTFSSCDFLTGDIMFGFENCIFEGTDFRGLKMDYMEFENCYFDDSRMIDCFSPDLRVIGGEIKGLIMKDCYFPRSKFHHKNISGRMEFNRCLLAGANFKDIENVVLIASSLTNATQKGNGMPSFCKGYEGFIDSDFLEDEVGYKVGVSEFGGDLRDKAVFVKILIPKGAKRVELTNGVRRTEKAKVLGIFDLEGNELHVAYGYRTRKVKEYRVGKEACVERINMNPLIHIGEGIVYFSDKTDCSNWIIKHQLYE